MRLNLDDLEIIEEYGGNSHNRIFLVKSKENGNTYILKRIKIINYERQINEIKIHKKLNSKYVVRLIHFTITKKEILVLIEHAYYGDLYKNIQTICKMNIEDILKFYFKYLKALEYIHSQGFVHRDIKPENILINKKFKPLLADFGTSNSFNLIRSTFCGTYEYMAPEVYLGLPQNYKIDIWASGILLFEMLHGYTPFKNMQLNQIKIQITEKKN